MSALGACVSFVQLLETDQDKLQLRDWIPMMFEVPFFLTCSFFHQTRSWIDEVITFLIYFMFEKDAVSTHPAVWSRW